MGWKEMYDLANEADESSRKPGISFWRVLKTSSNKQKSLCYTHIQINYTTKKNSVSYLSKCFSYTGTLFEYLSHSSQIPL
jgi:hypothetical protein